MEDDRPKTLLHGYWFVAYLDLCGIRRALLNTDFLPGDDPKKKEQLIEALKRSVGAIRRLRSQIAELFAAMAREPPKIAFAGLPPEKAVEVEQLQKARVRRDPISDGIVVSCPLMPGHGHYPTRAVWDGIAACMSLMLMNLAEGRALRGGLDVATAIEVDNELFGAALVRAYELESNRADYPRLVVGEGLVNYLRACTKAPGVELARQLEREMASSMLGQFIRRDSDGQWIVDYAGPAARELFSETEVGAVLLAAAKVFAHQERARYESGPDKDAKLFDKYSRLVSYLDSSLS